MIQTVLIFLLITTALTGADEKCCDNESLSLCGTMCEPSCENPHPNPRFCPGIQCTKATQGCRCDEQYLRNKDGNCVSPEDCDN